MKDLELMAREIVERTRSRSRWDMANEQEVPDDYPWLEGDIVKALLEVRKDATISERTKIAEYVISCGFATGHGDTTEEILKEFDEQFKEKILKVRKDAYRECAEIIQDDAYAISFQSMGQYRSALLKAILAKMEELK